MLDYGISPDLVRQYLATTRGAAWNVKRDGRYVHWAYWATPEAERGVNFLPTLFTGAIRHLGWLGFNVDQTRLTIIRSRVGDIETLKLKDRSYVVYDETFFDMAKCLTRTYFHRQKPDAVETHFYTYAVCAARYLAAGEREKAFFYLHEVQESMQSAAESTTSNHERLQQWAEVQAAFAVAHELVHCGISGTKDAVSQRYSKEYLEDILPYVRHVDETAGQYFSENAEEGHRRMREAVSSTAETFGDEYAARTATFYWSQIYPGNGRTFRLEDHLTSALDTFEDLGEEIICDALAAGLTVKYFESSPLPLAECLYACYSSSLITALVKAVDNRITTPLGTDFAGIIESDWRHNFQAWFRLKMMEIYLVLLLTQYRITMRHPNVEAGPDIPQTSFSGMQSIFSDLEEECAERAMTGRFASFNADHGVPGLDEYLASNRFEMDVQSMFRRSTGF